MSRDVVPISHERMKELREAVHMFLRDSSVYSSIRNIVDTYVSESPESNITHASADIMNYIREKGLIDDLCNRLHNEKCHDNPHIPQTSRPLDLIPGEYYLHMRLLGGRAFVDNLDISSSVADEQQMCLLVHFGSQRFRSSCLKLSPEPSFKDEFLLRIESESVATSSDLVDVSTSLHVAVVRGDRFLMNAKLVGENVVDWRRVLCTGYLGLTVELCGENPGVPTGIVDLQLELLPNRAPRFSEEDIANKIDLQRSSITAADREFLLYARRWWVEYQEMRSTHKQRRVKVFASTSSGRMVPVTHFVSVLRTERGIESPTDAGRFVSLFAVTAEDHLTHEVLNGAAEIRPNTTWLSMFAFLSQRRGDPRNHAALLCSLLLGFGLDAYCAIGGDKKGKTAMFVITRERSSVGAFDVILWESTSGDRFRLTEAHPYETIGCAFNNRSFYANAQPSDSIVSCSFDLENEEYWKPLNPLKLRMLPKSPNPPLLWVPCDHKCLENNLQNSLVHEVTNYRDARGIVSHFDDNLTHVLAQALCAYENHRRTGRLEDLSLFQAGVKGIIGEGRAFKGVPVNVTHTNSSKIVAAFNSNAAGRELLELTADNLVLAVRVKVFLFPEGIISVWVMLAAAYRPLPS
ncbi:CEP76 C2 domain [Trypanosoma vivax]|uniref:C2 domain-containing protein n=1 Tax=Trypanosoma vivax (strain Y486) TaxID=1055687 RepID=G0UCA1_TRYVY|nr:CEP76 C2 domain [Trypanosoma vivax]CCC53451.1 conserved hypothetical protein [Trypanosoma vivax Y486]